MGRYGIGPVKDWFLGALENRRPLRCGSCGYYTSALEADRRVIFTGRCGMCGGELVPHNEFARRGE